MEDELVRELISEAKAAHRARASEKKHTDRVKVLLPLVRAQNVKKYGPATLEEMIAKLLDRGTISRLTAESVGVSRKPADSGED